MKTINNYTEKRIYLKPQIECIALDYEISLALASDPPLGPDETYDQSPAFINNNPLKTDLA
jgi:hypothetical protein